MWGVHLRVGIRALFFSGEFVGKKRKFYPLSLHFGSFRSVAFRRMASVSRSSVGCPRVTSGARARARARRRRNRGGSFVRGAGAAAVGSRILGVLGPVAMIASVALTIGPLIARLVKSNDDISNNTKKQISQELNYPLFSSETLSSNASG